MMKEGRLFSMLFARLMHILMMLCMSPFLVEVAAKLRSELDPIIKIPFQIIFRAHWYVDVF